MPIYQYQLQAGERGCIGCRRGFELLRPASRAELEKCPLCSSKVKKIVSTNIASPKVSRPVDLTRAKAAGFGVFQKRDEGVYERL